MSKTARWVDQIVSNRVASGPQVAPMLVALLFIATAGVPGVVRAQEGVVGLDSVVSLTALETPTDDLIRLATEYADAVKEAKVAQLNIDTINRLRGNAVVTNLEVQVANLNLEAAQRKLAILRAIVQKQLQAAQAKLEIVKYLEGLGGDEQPNVPTQSSSVRAQDEATVRILKMILDMN